MKRNFSKIGKSSIFFERELLRKAAKEAIEEAHRAGIATTHGDENGIYLLHPNGCKEYINIDKNC